MTLFLNCKSLKKSFGRGPLFEGLSFSIFSGDRIGLIGPNGAGKSTLLKILGGIESTDEGEVSFKSGLKVAYVPQECEFEDNSPLAIVKEAAGGDELIAKVWLSKLGFGENIPSAQFLSGGWKKKLSLACALVKEPDLLLLDEPTNHLDIEGIVWLESFLQKEVKTYLLISHDRYFLGRVTNRIMEINPLYPEGIFAVDMGYADFLEKKEQFIEGQLERGRSLRSKARKEVAWMQSSPKARTTKSKSRMDSAEELLEDLSLTEERNSQKKAKIGFASTERETRKLLSAHNLGKSIGGKKLFEHLDFTLSPGTRLGLLGPNGCGKTTLLKILSGDILPDSGTLKKADDLEIIYFDQHRAILPGDMTLKEALSPRGDYVFFHGEDIHVRGWCQRFLFSPDALSLPLSRLSGGEKARISIAHLMLQKGDILLLDEPTNDLDIPTLEILEESLLEFPGAIVLITHDRCMMDRLCNTFISLSKESEPEEKPLKEKKSTPGQQNKKGASQIEKKILHLEEEIKKLRAHLEHCPNENYEEMQNTWKEIALKETQIEELFLRWQEQS